MLKAESAIFYGEVRIGKRVIIEENVVIGHPTAEEVAVLLAQAENFTDLRAFYTAAAKGVTAIGDDSIIRSGTVIYGGVTIGHHFDCGHSVIIREGSVVGNHVYMKSLTHIMRNVRIGDWCRLSAIVADNSTIGAKSSIFGTLTHRSPKRSPTDKGPWIGPKIGDDCLIGRGAVVLGPCDIEDESTVGANALVDFDVPPSTLVVTHRASPFIRNVAQQGGEPEPPIARDLES